MEMKSFLIIGLGRFGRYLAANLSSQNNEVLVVDCNEDRVNECMNFATGAQIGDATNAEFIRSLGIRNFDMCVVAIGDNFQNSLETTSLLSENGARAILARANSDVHKKFLKLSGATEIVFFEQEMAKRLGFKYGADNIFDYFPLSDDCAIYEIAVPDSWIGKSIIEKGVREKYNLNILATKIDGKLHHQSPQHIFKKDEHLMVIGEMKDVVALTK